MSTTMANFWFFLMSVSTRFLIVKEKTLGSMNNVMVNYIFYATLYVRCLQYLVSLIITMIFISMLNTVGMKYSVLK